MRVILTGMYFDDQAVKVSGIHRRSRRFRPSFDRDEKNDGLLFAWFRSGSVGPFDIKNYKWFDGEEIDLEDVGSAIDILLQDGDKRPGWRFRTEKEPILNPHLVEFVLEQDIIIEQSPPVAIPFKDLLKKTNAPILMGAYMMGQSIAGDHPILMFVTVPGGIIVIGSALGVAEALAAGLNKQIKKLFGGR